MDGHRLFRVLCVVALGATYITVLLGGNVIASGSGLACPDWPTCSGSLTGSYNGPTGIEWTHRLSALATSVIILALALVGLLAERRRPVLRNVALGALGLVVVEALLGGVVIESALSVGIVLIHFAIGTILLGLLLVLLLLANLREVPRRWIDWAREAADERPVLSPSDRPAPSTPDRSPAPPASAATGR